MAAAKKGILVFVALSLACMSFVLQPSEVASAPTMPSDVAHNRPIIAKASQQTTRPPQETEEASSGDQDVKASPPSECERLRHNASAGVQWVDLCYDSNLCSGELRVKFVTCETPRQLSKNSTLSKQLTSMGPDLLRMRLEGPEVHAVYSHHAGDCVYTLQIGASTAGSYVVGVERLYTSYEAVDELRNVWPNLRKDPVLPAVMEPTNYHLQQLTLLSSVRLRCQNPAPIEPSEKCTGLEPSDGRWKLVSGNEEVFTRVRVKKIQRNPIKFQWALQKQSRYGWYPNHCSRTAQLQESVLKRLSGKSIVIGGDSQLRALYYGLANFLNGNGKQCVLNISTQESEPPECIANTKGSQRKKINGVQIDYVDDLFLDKFQSSGRYDAYDIVVVGFAQHPASKEHWSVDKYRRGVDGRAARVRKLKNSGKSVVWYLAPQYPHTRVGYPVVVRDWRTDARLQIFNDVARRSMEGLGVPLLDGFAISTGMSHTSPDQAHFSNFVAFELVQQLLNLV